MSNTTGLFNYIYLTIYATAITLYTYKRVEKVVSASGEHVTSFETVDLPFVYGFDWDNSVCQGNCDMRLILPEYSRCLFECYTTNENAYRWKIILLEPLHYNLYQASNFLFRTADIYIDNSFHMEIFPTESGAQQSMYLESFTQILNCLFCGCFEGPFVQGSNNYYFNIGGTTASKAVCSILDSPTSSYVIPQITGAYNNGWFRTTPFADSTA